MVDEVFINLPSEKYNIGELVSQFETMGIDVTVNLNAFDRSLARNKQIREMAGLNVVTFSTTFYKTSHVIAKRIIDIMGALVGLILCGLVSIVLVPLIRKDGGSAIFAQTRIGKNGRQFTFYKFRSMCVDAEAKKENSWNKIPCRVECLRWTMILVSRKLVVLYGRLAWTSYHSFIMF